MIKSQVEFLVRHKISANSLSIFGFGIMVLAAIGYALPDFFLYNPWLSWIPVLLFFLSGYVDVLDGGVARASGTASKFGGFLDSTLDRLSDVVIVIGLMAGGMIWPKYWPGDSNVNNLLGYFLISVVFMISYTRSRAENEGVVMKGIGFMERAERVFIIMGVYIIEANIYFYSNLVPQYFGNPSFGYPKGCFFAIFMIIFTILCIWTLIARIIHAKKWLTGIVSNDYLKKHDLLDKYPIKGGEK
ncbi:MAG: CDP-alcohol phosphatidyltransferase family protein [Promethearchaeota archaeon]